MLLLISLLMFNIYTAVPPAYYAHLAAFRARYYIEGDTSDGASSAGRGGSSSGGHFQVLPNVHDNVKNVMFFC